MERKLAFRIRYGTLICVLKEGLKKRNEEFLEAELGFACLSFLLFVVDMFAFSRFRRRRPSAPFFPPSLTLYRLHTQKKEEARNASLIYHQAANVTALPPSLLPPPSSRPSQKESITEGEGKTSRLSLTPSLPITERA